VYILAYHFLHENNIRGHRMYTAAQLRQNKALVQRRIALMQVYG